MKFALSGILLLACLWPCSGYSQDQSTQADGQPGTIDKVINFPSKLFGKIQGKTASLDQQLTNQTEKYLQKMARREARLKRKLYRIDSAAANNLFNSSTAKQYAALAQKIKTDSGSARATGLSGEYLPYIDSLKGSLSFLQQNPQLLNVSASANPAFQGSITELQQLQAKMQDADQVKAFIQQRKQQIGDYISQHANLQNLLGSQYQGINQDLYYYSQEVRQYKEMLNNPDQLEQKALSLLGQLPAFQAFMKNNSQLAGLFNLPGNYGSPAGVSGLQTLSQVQNLIQGQLSSGGPNAMASLQSSLQSAQQQLDQFKSKLSQLGGGSGDIGMPDFKPNEQKTKTFWKRLEYGTNLQTTRTNFYFPTMTDIGLSVGYKLNNTSTIGVGASYKIGWGSGFNHISLSGQGAGLRSFLDIKIKSGFSATGGLEYNYTTPIVSLQQLRTLSYWTQSGLIGLSKTVPVKSRVLKQTRLQLLWDFLSYQQVPKTTPILFRVGYNF
jgi:hypothetical protein